MHLDGYFEHSFVLQDTIRDAKSHKKALVVAWHDLSNAFHSVLPSSVFRALEAHGFPRQGHQLYHPFVRPSAFEGVTAPIQIRSEVKPGCLLSPDALNLILEVVLPINASMKWKIDSNKRCRRCFRMC